MRFYDVLVNQSVFTEANRGLTSYNRDINRNVNVPHSFTGHTAWPVTFTKPSPKLPFYMMPQQQHQIDSSNKRQIQITLQALKEDATLSQHCAAVIYNVYQSTLSNRHAGQPSQAHHWSKSRNLDKLEEEVIVEHILELVAQGFSLRLAAVADTANSLRAECNMS
jgi:hypothetical protein